MGVEASPQRVRAIRPAMTQRQVAAETLAREAVQESLQR